MIDLRIFQFGTLFLVGISGALAVPSQAEKIDSERFSKASFSRAQAENSPILVETYAEWCAPCRIQAPIIARLRSEAAFGDVRVFRIDEKSPPDVWKRFALVGYGTLIAFKGDREMARATPLTEKAIAELMARATQQSSQHRAAPR